MPLNVGFTKLANPLPIKNAKNNDFRGELDTKFSVARMGWNIWHYSFFLKLSHFCRKTIFFEIFFRANFQIKIELIENNT